MSQVTHPTISLGSQMRSHWIAAVSALLALVVTTAVVLVLAIDSGSSGTDGSALERNQPALRPDGGPEESAVAASITHRQGAGPNEHPTAAAIGGADTSRPTGGPDESRIASSISGR